MRTMKHSPGTADEYMHALEEASNFNESMYFNVYDPRERVGGFFRLGNRANEGYAEMTTCIYLPDGRVGVHVQPARDRRQRRVRRRRHALRGDRRRSRSCASRYDGQGRAARRAARRWRIPRKAFTENPWVECAVDLTYRGVVTDVRRRARERRRHPARGRLRAVRRGPLRAAHRRSRARSGSATRSGRSTGSACATTRGARATGRRRGTTAGSRPTSATTSASWCRSSRRATAAERVGGVVFEDGEYRAPRRTRRSRPTGSATTSTTSEMRIDAKSGDRHLRDHRERAQPDPAAQPARTPPTASSS